MDGWLVGWWLVGWLVDWLVGWLKFIVLYNLREMFTEMFHR